MKDGTLKYTPKNVKSGIKVTFSSMKCLIKSTNVSELKVVALCNLSNNQVFNKNH